MVQIQTFFDTSTATFSYLVSDLKSRKAAIIDPVLDYDANAGAVSSTSADALLSAASNEDLEIAFVLETHAHADHLSAGDYIRKKTGAKIGIGSGITKVQETFSPLFNAGDVVPDGRAFDRLFQDGDRFDLGASTVRVMHTPGHTPACVTYIITDAAFVGDTIFMPDYGTARTDFPGGNATTLYRSIRRLLKLPPATRIFVGHDYPPAGRDHPASETTVADQCTSNIHIHDGVTETDYVVQREARDRTLATPRLIVPALQVNIRAGALPPAENDGHVYLKVPINRL